MAAADSFVQKGTIEQLVKQIEASESAAESFVQKGTIEEKIGGPLETLRTILLWK